MNSTSRLERIEQMLTESPGDTFLRYALAVELDKAGRNEESLAQFAALQAAAPPYIPAFFMAAQQLARLERTAEARSVLRTGIDEARGQGDAHAAAEMSEFLASLGSHGE